jgi:hypothetical protein
MKSIFIYSISKAEGVSMMTLTKTATVETWKMVDEDKELYSFTIKASTEVKKNCCVFTKYSIWKNGKKVTGKLASKVFVEFQIAKRGE